MLESHRESCQQGMRFDRSPKARETFRETYIVDHADGDNYIAKNAPNEPDLRGDVIRELNR